EVVDRHRVDAAQGSNIDVFYAGDIHDDVGDIAGEQQPGAIGGQVEALSEARSVELHRVGAVLAFDEVIAVTGVPNEGVVAGAHGGRVVATTADDEVVAVIANQLVCAGATGDGIVTVTAIDRESRDAGR